MNDDLEFAPDDVQFNSSRMDIDVKDFGIGDEPAKPKEAPLK